MVIDISVLICTFNRCRSLHRTLSTIAGLEIPLSLHWELLVVDNNSTDATRAVCEEFGVRLPLRYVIEGAQGLSHARNRAVREAGGELLLFTDDDVDVERGWLRATDEAAKRYPEAVFVGGRVIPRLEVRPPRWIADNLGILMSFPQVDLGDEIKLLRKEQTGRVNGANIGFRRTVFADNSFRIDLGPSGAKGMAGALRGEEMEFQERLLTSGAVGVYVPAAIVYHRDPPERMTGKYVRQWYLATGRTAARRGDVVDSEHQWFGVPRYLWRELLERALVYAGTRYLPPSRRWVRAMCMMCFTWGCIDETRKLRRQGQRSPASAQPYAER